MKELYKHIQTKYKRTILDNKISFYLRALDSLQLWIKNQYKLMQKKMNPNVCKHVYSDIFSCKTIEKIKSTWTAE